MRRATISQSDVEKFEPIGLSCDSKTARAKNAVTDALSSYVPDIHPYRYRPVDPLPTMISDNDLYRLAIFLGSAAMVLIILYHFVEVNTKENEKVQEKPAKAVKGSS
ncbi:oligosaccaryltransferase [Colletotrichum karsti]|uniref:Dolichyl-diphosphooligosaccharide--protein glycosyltransferase subunit 4 n=1 Tax=Colletotrichum karsti TaxID=1095194 RepID=A0A9P6I9M1_9PEZI|nr:oligosaccaryltransferase [Colletotrichum karsti]KAF9877706.1 oligosaccaryltransferase [Colletotrichum karsti]